MKRKISCEKHKTTQQCHLRSVVFLFFFKEAEMFWHDTHMMRQVCIHDEDEVASSVFHPMDVGSA